MQGYGKNDDPKTWNTCVKVPPDVIRAASEYARKSSKYTEDYEGWEDGYKKEQRITDGRIAQTMLYLTALKVGVFCKLDDTDHTTVDRFDVVIGTDNIESKTTRIFSLQGQVHSMYNQRRPDYYCFSRIDYKHTEVYVAFAGLVPFQEYWSRCQFIPGGEKIPGTSFINRFENGTNFLNINTGYPYKCNGVALSHYLNKWKILQELSQVKESV